MKLTQADCENLIDALQEWDDAVGPKELDNNEVGLDSSRFKDLMTRLKGGVRKLKGGIWNI
jgi:hypothetical protein